MKRLIKSTAAEDGHTLVESLVALVLLFIIVVPLTQFAGRLIFTSANLDKINAINLAQQEMETCILNRDFSDNFEEYTVESRIYRVSRSVKQLDNLVLIQVTVQRPQSERILAQLYTMRKADHEEHE